MSITTVEKDVYFKLGKFWQEYLISILTTLIFPLISLIIEYFISNPNSISIKSLLLGSSIYAASIAFLTQRKLVFILSFILSFVLAILFGISMVESDTKNPIPISHPKIQNGLNLSQDSTALHKNSNQTLNENIELTYISLPEYVNFSALAVIVFLFVQQLLERFNRHVILNEEFLIFK